MPINEEEKTDAESIFAEILAGNRSALARGITLIESSNPSDRAVRDRLLALAIEEQAESVRIAITGPPGAGKSTFINCFGLSLIRMGHRVAVLAVDPSSSASGGSILGDKTRMSELSKDSGAFIRPSPSRSRSGGVSAGTRAAISLVEAAGYDVVLIETVGVGQGEFDVRDMSDFVLLLALPGSGDEIQGMKRGIMEVADFIVVNKTDGENIPAARRTLSILRGAVRESHPGPGSHHDEDDARPERVVAVSSLENTGINSLAASVLEVSNRAREEGSLDRRRSSQRRAWFSETVEHELHRRISTETRLEIARSRLESLVESGELNPEKAAALYVDAVLRHSFGAN